VGVINVSNFSPSKVEVFQKIFPSLLAQLRSSVPTLPASSSLISEGVTARFENLLRQGSATSIVAPGDSNSNFLQTVQADLEQKILTPEPEIQTRLNEINALRAGEGKAQIDFAKTTREIESIMNDITLSDKEKREKIGQMRKQLGLSKKDMKKLFTKRLEKIYQQAADQIKTRLQSLKESVKEAEKTYGKNSPEAHAARDRLQAAQNQLEPRLQRYQHQASLYKSLFPGFWSKIGGFFKKIGSGLLKIVRVFTKIMNLVTPFLRFVPGIGQMIAFGWGVLQGFYQAFHGGLKGLLTGLLSFVRQLPIVGELISTISSSASKILNTIRRVYDLARGNLPDLFQQEGRLLEKVPGLGPFLSKTSDYLSFLISPLREKTEPIEEGLPLEYRTNPSDN